jgi:signal transduction histidine kinase
MQIGVDLLSDPAARENPSEQETEIIIASMRQAINTMQSIINDFLELRAMQDGKIALAMKPVVLADLVRQSLRQFEPSADDKQIALCTELDPGLPPVSADPDRLLQVFSNLFSNAIKFSPSGTSVTVRLHGSNGYVRVEVEDQGPGIVPHEIPLLFQEFTRLSNRPTGRERSSGVGLAIVRHIVELHRGRVGVDSEVGRGSCFWFELPLA